MYTTFENLNTVASFFFPIFLQIYNIWSLFLEKVLPDRICARFIQNTPLMECFFKKKIFRLSNYFFPVGYFEKAGGYNDTIPMILGEGIHTPCREGESP
jgi:hypothetical protein